MQKLGLVHVYVARILAKTEYFLTKCDVDNVNVGGRNSDMTRFDIQTEDDASCAFERPEQLRY